MFINSQKIINVLEQLSPRKYAESWDNVGLLIGNDQVEIGKIMVALDINEAVVEEAVEKNVDLIITHHPFIFKGLKAITDKTYHGRLIRKLIKEDIHVYAAHTNLDIVENGLNDYLANQLGLEKLSILEVTGSENYYKLSTFVPENSINIVEIALYNAGAGKLGNYDQCGFKLEGEGCFRPLEGSTPAIGSLDQNETVKEIRFETIVPQSLIGKCEKALVKAHPYETPAYDMVRLENLVKSHGLGRIGVYNAPMTSGDFITQLKDVLSSDCIKVAGNLPEKISKVGLCTGAGVEFVYSAKRAGCDVYITGDLKYHEAQLAEQLGICIIDGGHYETENLYMTFLKNYLEEKCIEKNYEVRVIKSESLENPLKLY